MQTEPGPSNKSWQRTATESRARTRLLLLVLACLVLAFHGVVFWGWIIDDAYVSFRYAHNLVHGRGLVFNPGEHVEGYTNFSWTILAAGAIGIGLEPNVVMPAIGIVSAFGLLLLVAGQGARLAQSERLPHPLAGIPAAFVMACSTGLALYSVTGLEMAFFALIQTVTVVALVSGHARTFALLAAIGFLTRPEAGLVAIGGLLLLGLQAWRQRRQARQLAQAIFILCAVAVPYLLFKWFYFGSLLPNTLAAKPPDVRSGLFYVVRGVLPLGAIVIAAFISAWRSQRANSTGPRESTSSPCSRTTLLMSAWALLTLAVVFEGGDFMFAHRMLLPGLAILALAADRTLLEWASGPWSVKRLPRIALLLGVLAYPALMARQTLFLHEQGALYSAVDVGRRQFADELVAKGIRSLATYDVGLLGYAAPDIRIIDLGGLTDRTIARAPGYYWNKEPPEQHLRALSPDAFVFTSLFPPRVDSRSGQVRIPSHYVPEDLVKSMPWFVQNYSYVGTAEVLKGEYFLHLFSRTTRP